MVVGHSLGGTVAARVAGCTELRERIVGVAMVDITECAGLGSLARMEAMIGKRPRSFPSESAAIAWATNSGMILNPVSASISVPAMLTGPTANPDEGWTWKTDLLATRPFWAGWFEGMDGAFLSAGPSEARRLLILNDLASMGKELTVAQMQGQIQVLPMQCAGHHIQEEDPVSVADKLVGLLVTALPKRNV